MQLRTPGHLIGVRRPATLCFPSRKIRLMDTEKPAHAIRLHDYCPESSTFLEDVLDGLSRPRKTLPSKYFYDDRGSVLFDRICELEEYYPTRTELAIMREHAGEMAEAVGERVLLIEYGSGSSVKTHILLEALASPAGYVPIDISREHLVSAAERIAEQYPRLEVMPVCADYTQDFPLPRPTDVPRRRIVYFPGSTIGNFLPERARAFLRRVRHQADGLLIGIDLRKEAAVLEAAYNDADGVTAAFNMNLLRRINEELGADFDLDAFSHRAVFNDRASRIEMHLVSRRAQVVRLDGQAFGFEEGETICTEYSHKYTVDGFADMAAEAGLELGRVWTDARQYFSVQYYHVRGSSE